ncbi:unnamed protein product [Urochloa humidicola]
MKRKQGTSGHDDYRERDGAGDESAAKKVKAAPDICDDVLLGIFSRLTSRDASRCAAMSRHHRQLIGGMDFWLLHRRLSPPLPRPHIAYMATVAASDPSNARHRPAPAAAAAPHPDRVLRPGCMFLDFHLADGDDKDELMRYSLIDRVHRFHKYVGTCDGIILMAPESFNGGGGDSILLLNPAIAGGEVEVDMELPPLHGHGRYRVTGFGYGPSRRAHKLLLVREELQYFPADKPTLPARRAISYHAKELLVYTLGKLGAGIPNAAANQQPLRSVLSSELDAEISGSSVCLDGKIYLLADHSRVLAFDVDDESVMAIGLPAGGKHAAPKLMEVSGRLCVAAGGGADLAMWLLASDGHEWVRLCNFWCGGGDSGGGTAGKLAGAWDFGGVLLLYFRYNRTSKTAYLHLYDTRAEKELARLVVPRTVAAGSGLVLCSGYRPTLVPPGSIVGAAPRHRGVLAALKPLIERDVAAGRDQTLEAVCFMKLLIYIASKLPDNAEDVIKEIKRRTLPFSLR